jgi:hypothetical protein
VKVCFGADVRRIQLNEPVSFDELSATVANRFSKVCLFACLSSQRLICHSPATQPAIVLTVDLGRLVLSSSNS